MFQLNIDCEGPITSNDNAYEICNELIPEGGELFARISKYDDYLADIEKRGDYKAGDTLKLILPFIKAWDITTDIMKEFSTKTLLLLPGTEAMLPFVKKLMPTFIISTSYRSYLDALCETVNFPPDQIYCTELDIDNYHLPDEEKRRIRELKSEINRLPVLDWPENAVSPNELSSDNIALVKVLDRIFWSEINLMNAGKFLKYINPIGGIEKTNSVIDSLSKSGNTLREVFYAGDSITDMEALEIVNKNGGLAMSFNGNRYALKSAKWAAIACNTALIGAVAHLITISGINCLEKMPLDSSGGCRGEKLVTWLNDQGASHKMTDLIDPVASSIQPSIILVDTKPAVTIINESENARKSVRGASIGKLG